MRADIRHEPQAQRFVIDADGGTALLQYRELDTRGTLDFNHTYTPPALRGSGIASRLTEHALRHAREHGYKVVPSCPFVAAYIARHPEYRDLLA
jgi:predicted GNAT family acetyltransferase